VQLTSKEVDFVDQPVRDLMQVKRLLVRAERAFSRRPALMKLTRCFLEDLREGGRRRAFALLLVAVACWPLLAQADTDTAPQSRYITQGLILFGGYVSRRVFAWLDSAPRPAAGLTHLWDIKGAAEPVGSLR
jgi:hypothetical protein